MMCKFTLRLFVLSITFFIGVGAVSVRLFDRQTDFDAQSIVVSEDKNKIVAPEINQIPAIDEEYAVYSAILTDRRYKNEEFVINEYTESGFMSEGVNLHQFFSALTKDTTADFQLNNEIARQLENKFPTDERVVLLSKKEEARLFRKGQDGWLKILKRYPKAHGVITFSAVGFNQNRTQALVNVSKNCGFLCGRGEFILLQKQNGKWAVEQIAELWVS
jgi:hypothetical protein